MIVTLDFETAYSDEYSLSRMSTTAYVLSPLFETIMCSIKVNDEPTNVYVGHADVARALSKFNWATTVVCSHNMAFDGAILAWRFGIVPRLYLDTLSMARATTHAVAKRSSLAAVAKYLKLPDKGDEVVRAKGKWLADFSSSELEAYAAYCMHDTDLCRSIYKKLRRTVPTTEIKLIDSVIRMFVCPQVMLDAGVLANHLGQVRADKAQIMARVAHIDKSVFSSNAKFAALLQSHGVVVPQKISPTTGEVMYALAKGDRAFKELCEDVDQPLEVQALLAARLNSKSTIEETRTSSFLSLSLQAWPGGAIGWAPVPLKYYGAHTGRLSGDGGTNWQNLKRGSPIRAGIVAPPGYRIVHRDASQIEARMLAVMAKCHTLIQAFAEGRDVYSEFASMVYHMRVTKADKERRFVGKTCLSAGTRVLTNTGVVNIEDVTKQHLLWDGLEWVSHDGLIAQGRRETLTLCGTSMTPDHNVWCGTRMIPASDLTRTQNSHLLRSALEVASSSSRGMYSGLMAASGASSSRVPVDARNTPLTGVASDTSGAHVATPAQRGLPPENATGRMPTRCQTTATARVFSTGSPPLSPAATPLPQNTTSTTGGEASQCGLSGVKIVRHSFGMFRRFLAGMIPFSTWIERITIEDTSPGISASSPRARTRSTNAMSRTLSNVSATLRPVFDLANAGPRHRFTVLTDAGPLIVSNCILGLGFQTGPDKLRHTLFIGNGGVSVNVELTEARDMVWTYRNTYPEIPDLWDTGEVMLAHMRLMGKDSAALTPQKTYPIVTYNERAIWLPNGMAIQYPNLRYEARPNSLKKETLYDTPQGTTNIFGGKVTENCDQALSRIVVTDIARRVVHQTSYEPFLSTHDSLDYCVPEHQVRDFDALLEYEFSISPTWAPNLPLASEGGWGRSLLDAERMLNT